MIAENSQTMTLAAAVDKTFDGEMCALCRMVAAAKRQELPRSTTPAVKLEGKLLLFFQPSGPPVVPAAPLDFPPPIDSAVRSQVRFTPPVPPPRTAVA